jgi:hypothetical protein
MTQTYEAPPGQWPDGAKESSFGGLRIPQTEDTPKSPKFQYGQSLVRDPHAFQKKLMDLCAEGRVSWRRVSHGTLLRRHEMSFYNPSEAVHWVAKAMAGSEARS